MARKPTLDQVIEQMRARFGPEIADAFQASIQDLKDHADLQRMVAAIHQGNIEAAIEAVHLDAAALAELLDAVEAAYKETGTATAAALPTLNPLTGVAAVIRFNVRNPQAENYLRQHSATLVTNVLEPTKAVIRERLTAGLERGENPTTTALDIVGRVDRLTQQRVGGLIGLSVPQGQFRAAAEVELANADPNYFTRELRDKRFDPSIRRAQAAGEAPPASVATAALRNYERRLLKHRGDVIGRTETLTALHVAQNDALRQAVASGAIPGTAIRRIWDSTGDIRVRRTHTHISLDGQSVGLDEMFVSLSGARLRFPGDPLGPAEEVIQCRCLLRVRIDWLANLQ